MQTHSPQVSPSPLLLVEIADQAQPANRPVLRQLADIVSRGATRDVVLDLAVGLLKMAHPHYSWLGVYLLEGDTLVLGPYIGRPTEHVRIPLGEGICGLAARTRQTVNVPDVNADPRYLACSLETRSELVVPIMCNGQVLGEIDVDSDDAAAFAALDEDLLQRAATMLGAAL